CCGRDCTTSLTTFFFTNILITIPSVTRMTNMVNKYDALKTNDDSGEEDGGNRESKDTEKLLPPVEVKPGEHRLQYTYCIWFSRRAPGKQATSQNYDQNLQLIGRM
ncbi:hypothetical protein OTU49_008954, partial [Cherax quadricarinatus]